MTLEKDLLLGLPDCIWISDPDYDVQYERAWAKVFNTRRKVNDMAFKEVPSLKQMNEQHRKRESKRCGRMIR